MEVSSHADCCDQPTRELPAKKKTQEDQNKEDEKARQKVKGQLIHSWMDRLQLVSVITTFFAAIDTQLLSMVDYTPSESPDRTSTILQTSYALLSSALVLHSFAAVIAFLGAFVLVKYKLKEEKREHDDATESRVLKVWSANPRLVQVGGVRAKEVPTQLLSQTHSISVATGAIGFFFAMAGIMCNIWALQGRAATTLSSATLGTCIIVSLTVIKPLKRAESTIGMIEKGL